jgi:hypothetical protein
MFLPRPNIRCDCERGAAFESDLKERAGGRRYLHQCPRYHTDCAGISGNGNGLMILFVQYRFDLGRDLFAHRLCLRRIASYRFPLTVEKKLGEVPLNVAFQF